MKVVYAKLELNKVLEPLVDERYSYIHDLSVRQLRHECEQAGIPNTGLNVIKIFAL